MKILPVATLATTAIAQTQAWSPTPAPQPPEAAQQPSSLGQRLSDAGRTVIGNPASGADRDMLRVLDALSDLSPRPIEKPHLNPIRRGDLRSLPPTTMVNAERNPLRSEGEALAGRLREAGVAVEQRTYEGVTHEFFGIAPVVADATTAQTLVAGRLREALGQPRSLAAR